MEKHWKAVISRSVCDYFFDAQKKSAAAAGGGGSGNADVPPVIATPHHYLISVYRGNVFFVAVCMSEGEEKNGEVQSAVEHENHGHPCVLWRERGIPPLLQKNLTF